MVDVLPDEVVNTLLLERSNGRLALVVEGPEDFFLLNSRIHHGDMSLTSANGKVCAEGVSDIIEKESLDWIHVLIDGDFDSAKCPSNPTSRAERGHTSQSNRYDLLVDCLEVEPQILRATYLELSDSASTVRFLRDYDTDFPALVLSAAGTVGRLRYAVVVGGQFSISTRSWRQAGLITAALHGEEITAVAKLANERSGFSVPWAVIQNAIAGTPPDPDGWSYACGHDIVDAVFDALKVNGADPSRPTIERLIRAKISLSNLSARPAMVKVSKWTKDRGRSLFPPEAA